MHIILCGARWPSSPCARRAIAEAKQRSQRSVIERVTNIDYLKFLHASKDTLMHLQSLAPTNPHWAWWVIARSPYVQSIRRACAQAMGILIG
jgi:hypothetical protein